MNSRTPLFALLLGASLISSGVAAQSLQDAFTGIIKQAKEKQGVTLPEVELPNAQMPEPAMPEPAMPDAATAEQNAGQTQTGGLPEPAMPDATSAAVSPAPVDPSTLDLPAGLIIDGFEPSYGTVDLSLMFPESDMANMRKILRFYESKDKASVQNPEVADQYDDYISQIMGEIDSEGGAAEVVPQLLPAYYLSSIIYRTPNNWSIWLNGRKFKAGDEIPGLEIASISSERVAFVWSPERLREVSDRLTAKQETNEKTYGNRSALTQDISVNIEEENVRFSLGRNQTFNAADMEVYEGKYTGGTDPFTYVAPAPEAAQAQPQGNAASASGAVDSERALMNELVENSRKIQNISIPRGGNNSE